MEFGVVDLLEAPNSDVGLGSEEHAEESRKMTFKKEQDDLEKAFGVLKAVCPSPLRRPSAL